MKQGVRYVATRDQVNLAWAEIGRGMPLVKAATWLTHLQYDLESPIWTHWIRFFGEHFRYIRYDERGCGMSDWKARTWRCRNGSTTWKASSKPPGSIGHSPCSASARAQRPRSCMRLRHPERVSHLILYGGYAVGGNKDVDPARRELYKAVMEVVRLGWGSDNVAFRQLFTSRFVPQGTQAQIDWFNELCRRTTSAANASALLMARGNIDVREYLPQVRTPTLVLHATHDHIAPLAQGKVLAAQIAGAAFIELDSQNHVLLEHEPAWHQFRQAVLEFTGQGASADGAWSWTR